LSEEKAGFERYPNHGVSEHDMVIDKPGALGPKRIPHALPSAISARSSAAACRGVTTRFTM